jgi:hypothetical protein
MAKYEPIRRYLARQKGARVELSFSEIERMIGGFLPKAASRAQWWTHMSREGRAPVQILAWGAAGYHARLTTAERVVFERT